MKTHGKANGKATKILFLHVGWQNGASKKNQKIVEYIHTDSSSAGCWEAKLTTQNGCDTWGIKQTVFAGYMYVNVYTYIHTYIYIYMCVYVRK